MGPHLARLVRQARIAAHGPRNVTFARQVCLHLLFVCQCEEYLVLVERCDAMAHSSTFDSSHFFSSSTSSCT
jgi:hypothetical protein